MKGADTSLDTSTPSHPPLTPPEARLASHCPGGIIQLNRPREDQPSSRDSADLGDPLVSSSLVSVIMGDLCQLCSLSVFIDKKYVKVFDAKGMHAGYLHCYIANV